MFCFFQCRGLFLVVCVLMLGSVGCRSSLDEPSDLVENSQTENLIPTFTPLTMGEMIPAITPIATPFVDTDLNSANSSSQSQEIYCSFPFDVGLLDWLSPVYWSPDGAKFVIAERKDHWERGLFSVIYLIDLNEILQQGALYQPERIEIELGVKHLAWSPNSDQLIITTTAGGFANPIFLLDIRTQALLEIASGFPLAEEPVWLPSSDQLSFITGENLHIVGLYEESYGKIISVPNIQDYSWSPDYQKIAVSRLLSISENPYKQEIFVIDPNTESSARLTDDAQCASNPQWSPNGMSILFESGQTGNNDLYVIKLDGTMQTNLTESEGFEFHAQWSPNGDQIVFVNHLVDIDISLPNDGSQDIFLINEDGSALTQLTFTPKEFELWPAWSPRGEYLAYVVYYRETRKSTVHLIDLSTLDQFIVTLP